MLCQFLLLLLLLSCFSRVRLVATHELQPTRLHGIFQARVLEWAAIAFSAVSTVQQSESAICIHICPLFWISFPFRSPQKIEQSSLCCTVGSPQLSIFTQYQWVSGKESTCQCMRHRRRRFDAWVGSIPWRRKWQPTPVFLPGKFHGQRNLAGYSPWGCKDSDTIEHTCMHALCHTVGSHQLPILTKYQQCVYLYLYLYISISQFTLPPLPHFGGHMFVLSACVFISALQIDLSLAFFQVLYICINILYWFFSF